MTFSLGYGFGLGITFVALILMKEGQPALLYLAPSVLIACTLVGYIRGELKALWKGRVVGLLNSLYLFICLMMTI